MAQGSIDLTHVRARLVETALLQSVKPSQDWSLEQRDCAGLIRYSYRKAVGGKEPLWKDRQGNKQFFVSAEELIANNFVRMANDEDEEALQSGDVLAFYSPEKKSEDRWHLMMILKTPLVSSRNALVIYHNGAPGAEAQIKKLWFAELRSPMMAEWNPRSSNPHFMGVYRWKGWL